MILYYNTNIITNIILFSISLRGPKLWNEVLNKEKKGYNPMHFSKNATK